MFKLENVLVIFGVIVAVVLAINAPRFEDLYQPTPQFSLVCNMKFFPGPKRFTSSNHVVFVSADKATLVDFSEGVQQLHPLNDLAYGKGTKILVPYYKRDTTVTCLLTNTTKTDAYDVAMEFSTQTGTAESSVHVWMAEEIAGHTSFEFAFENLGYFVDIERPTVMEFAKVPGGAKTRNTPLASGFPQTLPPDADYLLLNTEKPPDEKTWPTMDQIVKTVVELGRISYGFDPPSKAPTSSPIQ